MSHARRKLAQPILTSGYQENPKKVEAKPLPNTQAIDVVRVEPDISVEEVTLNINNNKNLISTPEEFWTFVESTNWEKNRKRGETRRVTRAYNAMNKVSQKEFKKMFSQFGIVLKQKIEETGAFGILERDLSDPKRAALISHIIGSGKQIYESVCESPYFIANYVAANKNNDQFGDYSMCFN